MNGLRRLLFLLPALVFVGVGVALAVGLTRDPEELPSTLLDRPLPRFDLPPIAGGAKDRGLAAADLEGHVSLLNVFASWCAPCRVEHPILARLAEQEGVAVYGVDYKDAPADARAYLDQLGDPYRRVGADRDGRVGIDLGITGVPETFVVDGTGRVVYRYAGPLTPEVVDDTILPLVEKLAP